MRGRTNTEGINESTATANQIEFIALIVQELTSNGVMEPDRLFQSPFTDLSAQDPAEVFPSAKVIEIVKVLNTFSERVRRINSQVILDDEVKRHD